MDGFTVQSIAFSSLTLLSKNRTVKKTLFLNPCSNSLKCLTKDLTYSCPKLEHLQSYPDFPMPV